MTEEEQIIPGETFELVQVLVDQTRRGLLEWVRGSSKTEFLMISNQAVVSILSVDGDGRHPIRFSIADTDGTEVETYVTDGDVPFGGDWSDLLFNLYDAARTSAAKSSKQAVQLLEHLRSNDIPF